MDKDTAQKELQKLEKKALRIGNLNQWLDLENKITQVQAKAAFDVEQLRRQQALLNVDDAGEGEEVMPLADSKPPSKNVK
jgi:hypothetical protein